MCIHYVFIAYMWLNLNFVMDRGIRMSYSKKEEEKWLVYMSLEIK